MVRAAENGHAETTRLLLEKGAAVNATNKACPLLSPHSTR